MSLPYYKTFKNFSDKKKFLSAFKQSILENIEIIAGKKTANKVETSGLENMHKFFSIDYLPFLQFALEKKLKHLMYEFLNQVTIKNLKMNKNFFIDKTLNFRFNYPYSSKIKSKLTRDIYRSLNLNNFHQTDKEINFAKNNNHKFDESDLTKIKYFKTKNNSLYMHSPHRDTWFAHSTNGINLWLAISKVKKDNGMLLYPRVYKYEYEHSTNPAYIKDDYNLGKPYKTILNSGELFIFNPEILHASHLNTSDKTRVVFSGRVDLQTPTFYKNSFQIKEPFWIESKDVLKKDFEKSIIFKRTKKNFVVNKRKFLTQNKIDQINFNFSFSEKEKYKIFKTNKKIREKTLLSFKDRKIGLIKKNKELYAFNALCPHLKINLLNSEMNGNYITCQGHGIEFNIKKKKSTCGNFRFKKYKIEKKSNYYILKSI